jgi:hypothetical protein
MADLQFKDQILDSLAEEHNVAQFVSFGPDVVQRYARVREYPPNHEFRDLEDAVGCLLRHAPDRTVNVRSFEPGQPRSRKFIQNLGDLDEVVGHVRRLAAQGLTTIVNETVDVSDGGVSGVATPTLLEFAPDSTPRCVEDDDVARLPRLLGDRLLETVYGFRPETPTETNLRLEFSIHPKPRGWRHGHTILWEREILRAPISAARPEWPNRFSQFLGDKTYGLLVGWLIGLAVPRSTAICRRVKPFSFGDDTGEREWWLRTCPTDRTPGRYTTVRGWKDPFRLLAEEDPEHRLIASVLAQQSVRAAFSGAAITQRDGSLRVEGVEGSGEAYMLTGLGGSLPGDVVGSVAALNEFASRVFGPVEFEWVHDGRQAWTVQLHVGQSPTLGDVIFPGDPPEWIEVPASKSLESLRGLVSRLDPSRTGIILLGTIGVSSHKGDLLRKAQVPSRLRRPTG